MPTAPQWSVDTRTVLQDLGSSDLDINCRQALTNTAYSLAGLVLPGPSWWDDAPKRASHRPPASQRVIGSADIEAIREMTAFFSRRDQRRGGADGRPAVVAHLRSSVADALNATIPSEYLRRDLFSAAAELAYLSGWMAFDASQHSTAQAYFTLAVRLAAEADDPPLVGHILRAMAHQAVDLGHPRQALDLAEASLHRNRYRLATPREKARPPRPGLGGGAGHPP